MVFDTSVSPYLFETSILHTAFDAFPAPFIHDRMSLTITERKPLINQTIHIVQPKYILRHFHQGQDPIIIAKHFPKVGQRPVEVFSCMNAVSCDDDMIRTMIMLKWPFPISRTSNFIPSAPLKYFLATATKDAPMSETYTRTGCRDLADG